MIFNNRSVNGKKYHNIQNLHSQPLDLNKMQCLHFLKSYITNKTLRSLLDNEIFYLYPLIKWPSFRLRLR